MDYRVAKKLPPVVIAFKWLILVAGLLAFTYRISIFYPTDFPAAYEIENFPLVAQPDGVTCGPTSVRMVLLHYGKDHPLEEIRKVAKTDVLVIPERDIEIGGTQIEFIRHALNRYGVPSQILKGDLEMLKQFVYEGRPPIVLVRSGTSHYWHYVVVTGFTENTIIVSDPGGGQRREFTNEQFQRAWDFTHSMYSGEKAMIECPVCGGDGKFHFMGTWKCDACNGTGEVIDFYFIGMLLGEQQTNLLVVPMHPAN